MSSGSKRASATACEQARAAVIQLATAPAPGARNKATESSKATIPARVMEAAASYVEAAEVVELIQAWEAEDAAKRYRGGRPATVPFKALVIAALACAMANVPVRYDEIRSALADPTMSTVMRQRLGFPTSDDSKTNRALDKARVATHYSSVARRYAKLAHLIDPKPFPCRRALTDSEIRAIDAGRDPEVVAQKQSRMDEFNRVVLATVYWVLPPEVRAKFKGDVTIDGTVIPVYGKHGTSARRRVCGERSVTEPNAGWHTKETDKRDPNGPGSRSGQSTWLWSFEAHIAETTGDGVGVLFPRIVVALSLDTPGQSTGRNAVVLLDMIKRSGLPARTTTVDRGYSQVATENFATYLRTKGYDLICDYKDDQLGVQAQHKGALMVEGEWYGACIPAPLCSATQDYRKGLIDFDTYQRRITEREMYRTRIHEVVREGEAERHRCPAQGKGATVVCPLRRDQETDARLRSGEGPVPLPLIHVPTNPPPVCTNASSTTIPTKVGLKYRQVLHYGSKEWHHAYSHRRNQIEGANRILKNGAQTNLGEPDRRRVRGLAKQNIVIAIYIAAANLATVARFMVDYLNKGEDAPPRRGRPARPSATAGDADTVPFQPLRIAGWQPKRRIA